jgi:hypothetical protein
VPRERIQIGSRKCQQCGGVFPVFDDCENQKFCNHKCMGVHYRTANIIHGHAAGGVISPEYATWASMLARCFDENSTSYPRYGGRGITVCERWWDFQNFLADVGLKPSPELSIDRFPDNNGNYEPGNVRWATKKQQARHRRSSRLITAFEQTLTLVEWCEIKNIPIQTLWNRLDRGIAPEIALTIKRHQKVRSLLA